MHGKDVKCVVDTQNVLQLSRIVCCGRPNNTIYNSRPCRHVTRARSNGHKTCNNTRAESNSRPLALESVVKSTPSDASYASSQVGDNGSHHGTHVGGKSRTSVESEPTNPEEDSADSNVSNVVGSIVKLGSTVSASLSEHEGVR